MCALSEAKVELIWASQITRSGKKRGYMRFLLSTAACALLVFSTQAQPQTQAFDTSAGPVKITPIYHASTLIEAAGRIIYVDPAQKLQLSGVGNGPDLATRPRADLIIVSDIHHDHMDTAALSLLSKPGTVIIAPPEVAQTVKNATVVANGQTTTWGKWTIEAIPMYNRKRGPAAGQFFHPKGRGNGYVLTYGGKRFYFSGDTEGIAEMRALKNIDVAFVCMYERPTMSPEEAADAVLAFHPKVVIPYHWGSSDPAVFQRKLEGSGIDVRILNWYSQS
jgi:L-ascorbate metabolism protein UlaG (beta-lactamase superfamily)